MLVSNTTRAESAAYLGCQVPSPLSISLLRLGLHPSKSPGLQEVYVLSLVLRRVLVADGEWPLRRVPIFECLGAVRGQPLNCLSHHGDFSRNDATWN